MTNYSSIRYAGGSGGGTTVYADMNALIAATGTDGAQAFVQSNNNIYIYSGSGWYKIATVQNDSPSAITGVNGTYSLTTDGTPTVITAVSTDPEGFPLTWTYSTSGLGSIATVSQVDNVFTITPSTTEADAGTFSLTINATDGVNGAVSANTSITLEFIIVNSNYTALLATAVDASVNNNITDSSTNNHTITVTGDVHTGTFSPYRHGGYSVYLETATSYVRSPTSADFDIGGTGDWSYEAWVYVPTSHTFANYTRAFGLGPYYNNPKTFGMMLSDVDSSNNMTVYWDDAAGQGRKLVSTTAFDKGQWNHILVARSGNSIGLFYNGTRIASNDSYTSAIDTGNTYLFVGHTGNGTEGAVEYIKDLRFINGSHPYDASASSITLPTEQLSEVTNTKFLLGQKPYLTDISSNNHALTLNGTVILKPFSPYDNLKYEVAANGGSIYIDGNEYIDIAGGTSLTLDGSDFTIEGWVYRTSTSNMQTFVNFALPHNTIVISLNRTGGGDTYVFLGNGSSWSNGATPAINSGSTHPIRINTWNHVALVNNSGTITLYHNGYSVGTTTTLPTGMTGNLRLGAYRTTSASGEYFSGYISDFRVSKSAIYTSDFTPTLSPFSSTGFEIHLKGTDASIIDKAQTNNLKLFGNTTGSTTQVKFADTKSMYFDGTGDYIKTPASTDYDLPTDFTIEAWIYPTALSSNRLIVDTYNASQAGSYQLYWRSTGGSLAFYTQADGVVLQDSSGSNIQVNTWHHVAVTRSGSTFRMFVDGTQVNSTTFTRDLTHGIPVAIGYQQATNTNYFAGYMQDVRITKGLARYTANFTPPTEPLKG